MTEQKFLQDLEKKLWTSANKLLPALDVAVYKHVVLGMVVVWILIFLGNNPPVLGSELHRASEVVRLHFY